MQMPWPLGRLMPARDSRMLDLPEDWSPTTTMVGSWMPSCMMLRWRRRSTASRRGECGRCKKRRGGRELIGHRLHVVQC